MQITLDLPDDVLAKADAVAKQESRSLGSLLADLVRSMKSEPAPDSKLPQPAQGYRFPVVEGSRPFTQEEIDRMIEEDGLP
jgi:hypothetical protein